eukprot:764020-Hanusia_phi.AAC.2
MQQQAGPASEAEGEEKMCALGGREPALGLRGERGGARSENESSEAVVVRLLIPVGPVASTCR